MKLLFTILSLILYSSICLAQGDVLNKDEEGKFIYYELVQAKDVSKKQLQVRINAFLKKPYKDLKLKVIEVDTAFEAMGKIIISKTLLVMSHPSGEILYNLRIEIKEEKFRFWLGDFRFVPYQRDRYGNFVAGSNKPIPLEDTPGKLNAAQWKDYQTQAAKFAYLFAKEFKAYVATQTPIAVPSKEKTVVKKDW